MPAHVLANPAMALAAQQLVAQRLLQQQMLSGAVRPMMPAQMMALQAQQAQLQQRMAAAAAPPSAAKKGAGSTRKRGRAAAAAAAAPAAAAAVPGGMVIAAGGDPGGALTPGCGRELRRDLLFSLTSRRRRAGPGHALPTTLPPLPLAPRAGKVVWAKVGSYPWWPAKTLDPQRDPSYPPDADPPRPTSIAIRCGRGAGQRGCCVQSAVQCGECMRGVRPLLRRCRRCTPLPPAPLSCQSQQPRPFPLPAYSPATACSFFGTFEFQWIGSKRALTDWEEVCACRLPPAPPPLRRRLVRCRPVRSAV